MSTDDADASLRPKRRFKLGRYLLLALLLGGATAGYLWREGQEPTKGSQASAPAATSQAEIEPQKAPARNTGAGAAASILAAADPGTAEARADAGPEDTAASAALADSESERLESERQESERQESERLESERRESERLESEKRESEKLKRQPLKREAQARTRQQKQSRAEQAATRKPAKKSTSNEPGYFTVNASPYATVFVDGKKVGITPIVKLKLKAGKHKVKLVSSEGGKSTTMSITIQGDEVVRKNVTF